MAQEQTYTEPELRARLKAEIQADDRGGRPGQWSARKAQLLVREYEKAGGGYVDDGARSESREHLRQWGEQEWQTRDGGSDARDGDGTSRYLPELAWKLLTRTVHEATESRKREGDEQLVANPDAARDARRAAELLTMKAADARKAVRAMDRPSQLRRARRAEAEHGKARKTVLAVIDERLAAAAGR